MSRGQVSTSDAITPSEFHRYFDQKVADVRASTTDASPPSFLPAPLCYQLLAFRPQTTTDVIAPVRALPDKQCASDPLQTRLLKQIVYELTPVLTELFNRYLSTGLVPPSFKETYITPLMKKPDLNPADVKSYRPISNLSVLSKLLERLVARQLLDYLNTEG